MRKQHIIYGDYNQDTWHSLRGIEDPKVIEFIDRIKELNWGTYSLYIYGGILLDRDTYDIDGTIMGPRDPGHINYLLDGITNISFELGVLHDIKWSQELYDPNIDTTKTCNYAYYRQHRWDDNKFIRYASLDNGLYMRDKTWPLNKTKGIKYPSPLKLF